MYKEHDLLLANGTFWCPVLRASYVFDLVQLSDAYFGGVVPVRGKRCVLFLYTGISLGDILMEDM